MKRTQMLGMLLALMLVSINASAVDYLNDGNASGYQISMIRPGGDRPCTLFTLVDVSVADASLTNSPWFVIEGTAPEYNQMVATLLAAKLSGRPIQVTTTGALSSDCGPHTTVSFLLML